MTYALVLLTACALTAAVTGLVAYQLGVRSKPKMQPQLERLDEFNLVLGQHLYPALITRTSIDSDGRIDFSGVAAPRALRGAR